MVAVRFFSNSHVLVSACCVFTIFVSPANIVHYCICYLTIGDKSSHTLLWKSAFAYLCFAICVQHGDTRMKYKREKTPVWPCVLAMLIADVIYLWPVSFWATLETIAFCCESWYKICLYGVMIEDQDTGWRIVRDVVVGSSVRDLLIGCLGTGSRSKVSWNKVTNCKVSRYRI